MKLRWIATAITRSRRIYLQHGRARYLVDNTNDDHRLPGREDYSVAMDGTTPPAAGFENTEQTASCPLGTTGDDVVVAAGEYGGATQEDADAAALAAAEAALVCVGAGGSLLNFDGDNLLNFDADNLIKLT